MLNLCIYYRILPYKKISFIIYICINIRRGNAVEPLSRVLEPLSVRHLDIDTDSPVHTRVKRNDDNPNLAPLHKKVGGSSKTIQIGDPSFRYGSIDKDPGVVSPMVWNMHCKRMQGM